MSNVVPFPTEKARQREAAVHAAMDRHDAVVLLFNGVHYSRDRPMERRVGQQPYEDKG